MVDLQVRRLGRTEIKPKALGLGCGYLGLPELTSEEEATATIREAIERGIDFIDTAPQYGDGASERRVGLALAGGWREKVYLQTKVGSHPRFFHDFSKEATLWSLANSFKQLQTDYVDSVLIHGPRYDMEPLLAPGACLDVLLDWKAQGRIGHLGIGVRQHELHQRAIETGAIDIVLSFLDYTLLDQSLAKTTIPLALEHDIGIILGSVLLGSLLAGPEPQRVQEQPLDQDGNLIPAAIGGPADPAVAPRAHHMWQWCQERGLNIRNLAMQFALNAPVEGNGMVLAGPANRKEFDEVYASATTAVPEMVWQDFEAAFGIRI